MLLDTNALYLPFRVGLDLVAEVERLLPGARPSVPAPVLGELDRLEARGVEHARAARALAGQFPSLAGAGRGDAGVLAAATRLGASVVTADRRFAERLRRAGVAVLIPRDRNRLHLLPGELPPGTRGPATRRGKV